MLHPIKVPARNVEEGLNPQFLHQCGKEFPDGLGLLQIRTLTRNALPPRQRLLS